MESPAAQSPRPGGVNSRGSSVKITEHMAARRVARHTVGLLLLALVIFMWTAGNFLGSSILADATYAKPFFLTYLNTAVFSLLLVPRLLKAIYQRTRNGTLISSLRAFFSRDAVRLFIFNSRKPHRGKGYPPNSGTSLLGDTEGEGSSPVDTTEHALSETLDETDDRHLDLISTARLSLVFCPLWFGANYFAMSALQFTAVASATILTSTASMWTLVIGTMTGIESFTWKKLCGVLASFFGIVLISTLDMNSGPSTDGNLSVLAYGRAVAATTSLLETASSSLSTRRALNEFPDKPASELILGDTMALTSAIVYGLYTTTLKRNIVRAHPRTLHMPTFFGFVGVFNGLLLLPVFPILHVTGAEPFELPPTYHVWAVLCLQTLASLFSDICWAYALAFTSPLVTTVGLSLTIPITLIGEMVLQGRYNGWVYWLGAMIVVGGFVFVDQEEVREEQEREQEHDGEDAMRASTLIVGDGPVAKGGSGDTSRDFGVEEQGRSSGQTRYGSMDERNRLYLDVAPDAKGKARI